MTSLSYEASLWTCQRGANGVPVDKLIVSVSKVGLEVLLSSRTSRSPSGRAVRTTTEILRTATDNHVVRRAADDPLTCWRRDCGERALRPMRRAHDAA